MHYWSIIDTSYIYDGTIEGVFTIVYHCLKNKTVPTTICLEEQYGANLLEQPVYIKTDTSLSLQVQTKIKDTLSSSVLYHIYTAFLSGDSRKAKVIVYYIIYAFKYGKSINSHKSIDCVIDIQHICRNVTGEAHRMYGFLRFKELENHFLYAKYSSDNDILIYLANHFKKRLPQEIWIIHDEKRKQVALYNRVNYVLVDADTMDFTNIEKQQEDMYLDLWKKYFQTIAIKERKNARCQRQFMPKKYWQYMPETTKK